MTENNGAPVPGRAGGLRPEPQGVSALTGAHPSRGGWKLVPIEPTREMLEEGRKAFPNAWFVYHNMLSAAPPRVSDGSAEGGETQSGDAPRELRHFPRRAIDGSIQIVDRQFDFVRAVLPYSYAYSCNAQQWDEAARICEALEGPMMSLGVVRVSDEHPQGEDASAAEGRSPASAARRETPEHRARQTYELLISDPHRPGALETLTSAFRACENDALERAAETLEEEAAEARSSLCCGSENDDFRAVRNLDRHAKHFAARLRSLKHKEPT